MSIGKNIQQFGTKIKDAVEALTITYAGLCRRGSNGGAAVADPPKSRRKMMRALGYVALVEMAVAGILLGVLAVQGLPDLRRYVAMRKM
jgi:hypothetical protein